MHVVSDDVLGTPIDSPSAVYRKTFTPLHSRECDRQPNSHFDAEKARFAASTNRMQAAPMTAPSTSISFRLDAASIAVLDDYCQRSGLSRGAACRTLVINSLAGGDNIATSLMVEQCLQQLEKHQSILQQQRRHSAYLLYAILTQVGQKTPEAAAEVVRNTFTSIDPQEQP
jgi:hypothetical protein